jgi:PPK2 family polyphosphate:nucleotide phosphotransferase
MFALSPNALRWSGGWFRQFRMVFRIAEDYRMRYRISQKNNIRLADWDPDDTQEFSGDKLAAQQALTDMQAKLVAQQEMLYADGSQRLLVVLQAMDTGGKDGVIRKVFGCLNPAPTSTELAHDYLWRVHAQVPAKGELVIFNRSHYEDVLVVRVHNLVPQTRWELRYQQIVNFEQMLVDEGTTILKFFLHISADEQKERLEARLADQTKHWKFNVGDLAERKYWQDYMAAYEAVLRHTSTDTAPWYLIPANKKWYRDWLVTKIVLETLQKMHLKYPENPADLSKVVVV